MVVAVIDDPTSIKVSEYLRKERFSKVFYPVSFPIEKLESDDINTVHNYGSSDEVKRHKVNGFCREQLRVETNDIRNYEDIVSEIGDPYDPEFMATAYYIFDTFKSTIPTELQYEAYTKQEHADYALDIRDIFRKVRSDKKIYQSITNDDENKYVVDMLRYIRIIIQHKAK